MQYWRSIHGTMLHGLLFVCYQNNYKNNQSNTIYWNNMTIVAARLSDIAWNSLRKEEQFAYSIVDIYQKDTVIWNRFWNDARSIIIWWINNPLQRRKASIFAPRSYTLLRQGGRYFIASFSVEDIEWGKEVVICRGCQRRIIVKVLAIYYFWVCPTF